MSVFNERWPQPGREPSDSYRIEKLERTVADLRSYLYESIKAYEAQNHRITQLEALYDKSLKQRAALLKKLEDQAWHTRWNRGR